MLLNKTRTVFSRAAQDGDIGALVALLPQVLDLGESDITLLALLNAAELGRSDVVMFLLDVGCVTAVDEVNRESAISLAAANGHISLVQLLLTTGKVAVNHRNSFGETLLIIAINGGHTSLAKWLVTECGADTLQADLCGWTALLWAMSRHNYELVKWLLTDGGSLITDADKGGTTTLLVAAENHPPIDFMEWLLTVGGSSITEKDSAEMTAMLLAVRNRYTELVKWLITEAGANVTDRDEDGQTALLIAAQTKNLDIVQWLLSEGGSNIAETDNLGHDILSHAATDKNGKATDEFSVLRWLLVDMKLKMPVTLWTELQWTDNRKLLFTKPRPRSRYPSFLLENVGQRTPSPMLRFMLMSDQPDLPLPLENGIFQYISAVCEHAAILRQQLPHLCTSLTQLVSAHLHAAIASLVTEYSVPSADECWSFQLQLSGKEPKKKRKPNRGNKMNKTKKFHGNLPSA